MRETTDIAMGVNACITVLVDALLQARVISSEDVLVSLARVRRGTEKTDGGIGPITDALLRGIEVTAGPDEPRNEENPSEPRWRPIVIQRNEPDGDA